MASGVMHIRYGSENISSRISSAVRELSSVSSKLDGVRDRILDLPERSRSGDNLSRASSFLRKKQQEMERREDALEVLKTRCNTFISHVETTEKRLSQSIKHNYKQFHNVTGIGKTAAAAFFEKLFDTASKVLKNLNPIYRFQRAMSLVKNVIDAVGEWYNNGGKYIVDCVLAVLSTIATVGAILALTLTGPVGVIAAIALGITLANDILEISKAGYTAYLHYSGNPEAAREIREMSVGDCIFGEDSTLAKLYDGATFVASVTTLAIDLASLGKVGMKAANSTAKGASKFTKFKEYNKAIGKTVVKNFKDNLDGFKDLKNFSKQKGWGIKMLKSDIFDQGSDAMKAFKGITHGSEYPGLVKNFAGLFTNNRWDQLSSFLSLISFGTGGSASSATT